LGKIDQILAVVRCHDFMYSGYHHLTAPMTFTVGVRTIILSCLLIYLLRYKRLTTTRLTHGRP